MAGRYDKLQRVIKEVADRCLAFALLRPILFAQPGESAVGWHADKAYWSNSSSNSLLTAWVPFHDCDEAIGPLAVLDGSHKWPGTQDMRLFRNQAVSMPELHVCVVGGRMSLVGPRPLLAEYLDKYSPHHARRHDVRPGITGLAQVSGRKSVAYSEKLDLDVRYIDEWSFRLDLRILFKALIEPFKHPETRGFAEFDDVGLTLGPPWVMPPTSVEECGSDP